MLNNELGAEVVLNCCAGSACLKDNTFLRNSHENMNYELDLLNIIKES